MSPETLDAMLAAGVTAEVLAAAWKAEIAKQEAATQDRRSKDAERQRRHRGSRDVTVTACESQDKGSLEVSPPAPPLPKTSKSPPLSPPKILTEEKRKAIASCLRLAFAPPPGVSDEQWAAFCGQRRKKLNDRSYLLLTNKLAKLVEAGWPAGELIDRAIESGWETVFAPNTSQKGETQKRYVSKSGYEYRGDPETVQREAQRRGDNDTYWQVEADRKRKAVPIGNVVQAIVDRAA